MSGTPVTPVKVSEEECLAQVKIDIKENRDLSFLEPVLDDEYLIGFIRGRKYNPEQVIKTISKYYHVKKKYPEIFKNLLPSQVSVDMRVFGILRQEDEFNKPTLLITIKYWDPQQYQIDDLVRQGVMLMDTILRYDVNAQNSGMNLVLDLGELSFKQCRHFTPLVVQKLVNIFWGAFPMQYKEAHVVNTPWCFTMLISTFRTFLPKKFNDRLKLHTAGDLKQFHLKYDPSILPASLQGLLTEDEHCLITNQYQEQLTHLEPFYSSLQKSVYGK